MTRAPERPPAGDEGACAGVDKDHPQQAGDEGELLRDALTRIKKLKQSPIGDTGFQTGPQALLDAAQRIAREALRAPRQSEAEQTLRERVAQLIRDAEDEIYCACERGEDFDAQGLADRILAVTHPMKGLSDGGE